MSDVTGNEGAMDQQLTTADKLLSVTDQCELLASIRRRHVLRYLRDHADESVSLTELTEYLYNVEERANKKDIRIALHQLHLPKLAQAGIITYTTPQHTATYQPHPQLEELLTFLEKRETPDQS